MKPSPESPAAPISLRIARAAIAVALLALAAGCRRPVEPRDDPPPAPEVSFVKPERRPLCWTVLQPGSIEAFEETAILPKIAGYVEQWNVDIGDHVTKGQVLAKLWIPDLEAQCRRRRAEVDQARKLLEVAEAHQGSAASAVEEARAAVARARAELTFRQLQLGRVNRLRGDRVVDKVVEDESTNQFRAAEAMVREAEARVARAEANRRESEASRNKARVDISVAQAALAEAEALVGYATLRAPFDGIVVRRRINTGDFVQPAAGGSQEPLYVVERRDTVRVFVEVPEVDAVWVRAGTPARIRIPTAPDRAYRGCVRRISYALRRQTRTLVAEIDLPNPDDLLRPGMYAVAELRIRRDGLLTLPTAAISSEGNVNEGYRDYCFVKSGTRVRRVQVELGARGDGRVQVLRKRDGEAWADLTGDEMVAIGDLASLADGLEVRVAGRQRRFIGASLGQGRTESTRRPAGGG